MSRLVSPASLRALGVKPAKNASVKEYRRVLTEAAEITIAHAFLLHWHEVSPSTRQRLRRALKAYEKAVRS